MWSTGILIASLLWRHKTRIQLRDGKFSPFNRIPACKRQTDTTWLKYRYRNYCVPKKYTTEPPTIILTVVVQLQKFLVQILLSKYVIESGLISHLTRLMYVPYLGKL